MRNIDANTDNKPFSSTWADVLTKQADQCRTVLILLSILVYLILAEYLCTTLETVRVGLVMHGLALLALILLTALLEDHLDRRIYLTLAFAPLIRLVSLSLPLERWPTIYWYLLVGVPISISVFLAMRFGGFTSQDLGLTGRKWFIQFLFGISGIGLGYIEYLILRPEPLVNELTLHSVWLPALILMIFTGFLEEIIFRGLMQSVFTTRMHCWAGILIVSIVFAGLHLGYNTPINVLFVFMVAILFAWITARTGSILGVSLAHGLTNVTLLLVFPFVIGQGLQPFTPQQISYFLTRGPTPTAQVIHADPTRSPFNLNLAQQALLPTVTRVPTGTRLPTLTPSVTATILPIFIGPGDTGFLRQGGKHWLAEQGYQGGLVWAFTRVEEPDVRIAWEPELAVCGRYRFEVFIPADFGLAPSIIYTVTHRSGIDEVEIDQSRYDGEWALLGNHWCLAGRSCRIETTNLTGVDFSVTFAAYDTVRLTFLEGCR